MTRVEALVVPAPSESGSPGGRARLSLRSLRSAESLRQIGLLAALGLVWVVLQANTNGLFLTPRNLGNLSVQFAVTAILAVGIVMVMTAAEIDLSASATVGICAILAAGLTSGAGLPAWAGILAALGLGLVIGLWHAVWVVVGRVPSFITTLASLLGLGGLALVLTNGRTVVLPDSLSFIANGYLPGWTTLVFGAVALVAVLALGRREMALRTAVALEPSVGSVVVAPVVGVLAVVAFAGWVFLGYRGVPIPVVLLLLVFAAVTFTMRYTVAGRYILAVGTDQEASRRAGINVALVRMAPFVVMGLLYGVCGLVFASRLGAAPAQGMVGEELNVIAAAVLGGTSLFGGISRVGGAVIGALLMESLTNGMVLMNVSSFWQQIVVGAMLLIAVCVDVNLRRGRRG